MKLYSGPLSLFTAKVRIALREKGVEAEIIDVPFGRQGYQPKHPEVEARNPKAQVPVLVDGDVELWDSTVILEYLEDLHPEPALYPRDPAEKATCRQLEHYADEVLFASIFPLVQEVFYKTDPAARDAVRVAESTATLRECYAELDARLAGREWFCGDYGVADITIFLCCMFGATLGVTVGDTTPHLATWIERMNGRPAVAAEAAEMMRFAATLPPQPAAAA
ncbi:MAG: glutathione S-transferase family protein [Deltaproteobacteria bacterium]|nr:glutathione S-transferase family protein [Deltaproteobacteria bacterium]